MLWHGASGAWPFAPVQERIRRAEFTPPERTKVRATNLPATVARRTSRISAITLLASVEPGSKPAVMRPTRILPFRPPRCLPAWSRAQNQPLCPPRDFFLFGHHAACQRGAVFKTSRRARHAISSSSATTLLASVEPCSKPAVEPATRFLPLWPPRCSPAWSRVQNQPSSPPRDFFLFGHHAACQRGAVFKTSRRARHAISSSLATTLASSVVAKRPSSGTSLVLNTAPRWRAAWWRRDRVRGDRWS